MNRNIFHCDHFDNSYDDSAEQVHQSTLTSLQIYWYRCIFGPIRKQETEEEKCQRYFEGHSDTDG